jgi:periplasmic divalent cation tolerance protein
LYLARQAAPSSPGRRWLKVTPEEKSGMAEKILVLVTAPDTREAERIASALVGERLAACVNICEARVRSAYRWKGKVETAREVLLLIKTTRRTFPAVARRIRALHSYEVPEIIALPIVTGSRDYLAWLESSVARPKRAH